MAVAGSIVANLTTNNSKWNSGFRKAQSSSNRFKKSVAATATSVGKSMTRIGAKITAAATAMAVPIGLALRQFTALDDNLRLLQGITSASGKSFEAVSDQIKQLGRTTSFTASQVAEGAIALGRAGFATKEIQSALPAILNLSRATGTELAEAADIAGNSLRGFGLNASQTTRVADILTATANGSAQTLTDLSESLKFVAPVANQVGASIEETAASLGVLANIGIKASSAGTALRQSLIQLATPKVQKTLRGIGVSATDAAGNFRPLNKILADVARNSDKLSKADKLSLFVKLFGARAAGAAISIGSSAKAVSEFEARLSKVDGVAQRTATQMDKGVGGAFRRFQSSVEGIAIAIGTSLEPTLKSITDRLSAASGRITEFINNNQQLVRKIVAGVAAVGALGVALSTLGVAAVAIGSTIAAVTTTVSALSVIVGGAITAITATVGALTAALGLLLSPVGLITAGLAAGIIVWAKWTGAAERATASVRSIFQAIKADIGLVVDTIKSGNITAAWEVVTARLNLAWVASVTAIKTTWIKIANGIRSVAVALVLDVQIKFEQMILGIQKGLNVVIATLKKVSLGRISIEPLDIKENQERIALLRQTSNEELSGMAEQTQAQISKASEPLIEAANRLKLARENATAAIEKAKAIKPMKIEPPEIKPVEVVVPKLKPLSVNVVADLSALDSKFKELTKDEARKRAEEALGSSDEPPAGKAVDARSAEAITAVINAGAQQNHQAKLQQLTSELLEQSKEQKDGIKQVAEALKKTTIVNTVNDLNG